MKVHHIKNDPTVSGRAITSCRKTSAGPGIIKMKCEDGNHVFRFALLRRSFSAPVSDFLATKAPTLVDCANCRRRLR